MDGSLLRSRSITMSSPNLESEVVTIKVNENLSECVPCPDSFFDSLLKQLEPIE